MRHKKRALEKNRARNIEDLIPTQMFEYGINSSRPTCTFEDGLRSWRCGAILWGLDFGQGVWEVR
jgi:hypothetical protein